MKNSSFRQRIGTSSIKNLLYVFEPIVTLSAPTLPCSHFISCYFGNQISKPAFRKTKILIQHFCYSFGNHCRIQGIFGTFRTCDSVKWMETLSLVHTLQLPEEPGIQAAGTEMIRSSSPQCRWFAFQMSIIKQLQFVFWIKRTWSYGHMQT